MYIQYMIAFVLLKRAPGRALAATQRTKKGAPSPVKFELDPKVFGYFTNSQPQALSPAMRGAAAALVVPIAMALHVPAQCVLLGQDNGFACQPANRHQPHIEEATTSVSSDFQPGTMIAANVTTSASLSAAPSIIIWPNRV
jgi:hypothetical protein